MEWRKCEKSFAYFFSNYWKVLVPNQGIVPVDVRQPQMESAELFQNERRVLVLKARQIGWSTLITAYLFWKTFFFPNTPTMALSRREDPEAYLIISNAKMGYANLPAWMRNRGPKQLTDNMTEIRWGNGSMIESDSSKDNPARGRTFALLVLDEFGKMPNPDDAWGSALPATEYGQLIVVGNANGFGTRWFKLYQQAKAGESDFVARFYPWNVVPHRDSDWLERETSSMTPAERAAEYPTNDEECWVQSGNPVYDVERLKVYPTSPCEDVRIEADLEATLTTWAPPEEGKSYVIGMDVSLGKGTGDYTVANVIEVETGRHVCEWRSRMATIWQAAERVNQIGLDYNQAWLAVEHNGVGEGVINRLREHHNYPNLYYRKVWNRAAQSHVIKYGWDTSGTTKPQIVSELQERLFTGEILTTHSDLVEEMIAYRYLANGQMGGMPHDDRVMSMAIAVRTWYEHPKTVAVAQHEPPPEPGTLGHDIMQSMGEDFFNAYYNAESQTRFTMNGERNVYA